MQYTICNILYSSIFRWNGDNSMKSWNNFCFASYTQRKKRKISTIITTAITNRKIIQSIKFWCDLLFRFFSLSLRQKSWKFSSSSLLINKLWLNIYVSIVGPGRSSNEYGMEMMREDNICIIINDDHFMIQTAINIRYPISNEKKNFDWRKKKVKLIT